MDEHKLIAQAYRNRIRTQESLGEQPTDQAALAKGLKVSQGYISHLMTGRSELNLARGLELATLLKCTLADLSPRLAVELEASRSGIPIQQQTAYKSVKMLNGSPKEVVDLIKEILKGNAIKVDDYIHWPYDHSEDTYAVQVTGESMSPVMPDGSTAIVDTQKDPEVGNQVYILQGSKALFATWKGDDYLELANTSYPDRVFQLKPKDSIIGTVIGKQIKG